MRAWRSRPGGRGTCTGAEAPGHLQHMDARERPRRSTGSTNCLNFPATARCSCLIQDGLRRDRTCDTLIENRAPWSLTESRLGPLAAGANATHERIAAVTLPVGRARRPRSRHVKACEICRVKQIGTPLASDGEVGSALGEIAIAVRRVRCVRGVEAVGYRQAAFSGPAGARYVACRGLVTCKRACRAHSVARLGSGSHEPAGAVVRESLAACPAPTPAVAACAARPAVVGYIVRIDSNRADSWVDEGDQTGYPRPLRGEFRLCRRHAQCKLLMPRQGLPVSIASGCRRARRCPCGRRSRSRSPPGTSPPPLRTLPPP